MLHATHRWSCSVKPEALVFDTVDQAALDCHEMYLYHPSLVVEDEGDPQDGGDTTSYRVARAGTLSSRRRS